MASSPEDQIEADFFDRLAEDDELAIPATKENPLAESSSHVSLNGVPLDGGASGKGHQQKGTGVKVAQWSDFSAIGSRKPGTNALNGSFSDLLGEQLSFDDPAAASVSGVADDGGVALGSTYQLGLHHDGTVAAEPSITYVDSDSCNASPDNGYPGWQYDPNTGQYFKIDAFDDDVPSTQCETSDTGYGANVQYNSSFVQVLAQPRLETIEEEGSAMGGMTSWVHSTKDSVNYPPNMVFDPQYPGWYYDTITRQWYELSSYSGTSGMATNTVQNDTVNDESSYGYDYSQQVQWQPAAPAGNAYTSFEHSMTNTGGHLQSYGGFNGVSVSNNFAVRNGVFQEQSSGNRSLHHHLVKGYDDHQYQGGSHAYHEQRSSGGRPPHALVSFGFGGKLVVLKQEAAYHAAKFENGDKDVSGGAVSIVNLSELFLDKMDVSSMISGSAACYMRDLSQHLIAGPLVGGNTHDKDVYAWLDKKAALYDASSSTTQHPDHRYKLFLLLKILCQHKGKLHSSYRFDLSEEEAGSVDVAVARLLSSDGRKGTPIQGYSSFASCVQNVPSAGQIQATAEEVQKLLVSGRRKDALKCAQEGQLWGLAFVLASKLGEKCYFETVKKMAECQFVSASPLRTLCLLAAGDGASVVPGNTSSLDDPFHASQQAIKFQYLDNWEDNLAIITANRTEEDQKVVTHLGDCLWRDRDDVIAAHTCYLVAEEPIQSYSTSVRICLIGADHLKYPRTFASPEAIQRTEVYEYALHIGNSQHILLPFHPFKLLYAYMLVEVGKVSESLRYCQASLKLLKSAGRAHELEAWKSLFSSLEERIRFHQQGGDSLATVKILGVLINRLMGAPNASVPPVRPGASSVMSGKPPATVKVTNSQSVMDMSTMDQPASVQSNGEPEPSKTDNGRKKISHGRSVSEPNSVNSPRKNGGSNQSKGSMNARLGVSPIEWIGTKLLNLVPRPNRREANLGVDNNMFYDEARKQWVEKGAEPAAEAAPPLGPPPTALFQNGASNYSQNGPGKAENPNLNGFPEKPRQHSSGIPAVPPVRARYVDTFNKGNGAADATKRFQSPAIPSLRPAANAKFFVPAASASFSGEQDPDSAVENQSNTTSSDDPMLSSSVHQFPGCGEPSITTAQSQGPLSRQRSASWGGVPATFGGFETVGRQSFDGASIPCNPSHVWSGNQLNTAADELQDVAL